MQKGLANKDYQENKSHNNFTSNSHNEKLNNSKSETSTHDLQINNRQSCDHVKLCQTESSNCPSKKNSGNEINYANNSYNKEKETGNKTELKESSKKNEKEKRVFVLGDSILNT